jgi:hypothetical protein
MQVAHAYYQFIHSIRSAKFAGIVQILPQIFRRPLAVAGRRKLTQSQRFAL